MRSREQADALQGELQVSGRKFAKHLRDLRHRWHKARMSHDWIQLHKLNSKVSPAHPPACTLSRLQPGRCSFRHEDCSSERHLMRASCVCTLTHQAAAWPIHLQCTSTVLFQSDRHPSKVAFFKPPVHEPHVLHTARPVRTHIDAVVITALQPMGLKRCRTTCRLEVRLSNLRAVPAELTDSACQSRLCRSMPVQPARQDAGSAAPAWWTASMGSPSILISLWLWRVCMQLRVWRPRSVRVPQLVQRSSSGSRISSNLISMSRRGGSGQQQLLLGDLAGHPLRSWMVASRGRPRPCHHLLHGQVLLQCSQGGLRARGAELLSPAAACCSAEPHQRCRGLLMPAATWFPVAVAVPQQVIQTPALLHAVAQACP